MSDTEGSSDQLIEMEEEPRDLWSTISPPAGGTGEGGIPQQETQRRTNLTQGMMDLRAPWVPAPAKTSSQTNIIFSRKTRYSVPAAKQCDSETKISEMSLATPQTSLSSISESAGFMLSRPPPPPPAAKKTSSHTLSRHKLQSKDSFVDVTACLTRKRNRIMKIWEDSISTATPELLAHLESANKYGQQAATQLEKLKSVSSDIHKGSVLKDAHSIESLRETVMDSLRRFEDENKVVQTIISRGHEESIPVECSPAAGDRTGNADLSLLNKLYSEKFSLTNASVTASNNPNPKPQQQPLPPSLKSPNECRRLEEKIVEQQETVKTLESELKRVESQCAFDFRLLKSNLDEKLEDLNGFPEILHITEMKLAQCVSRNVVLEKIVQDRENENAKLTVEVNSNKSKVESLTEKLRSVECENAQLKGRIKELEEFTIGFRQGSSTESILKTIESKLEFLRTDTAATKIQELEDKLKLAKKHIQHQKRAKEDVTNRLTRRVEELMQTLDESRQKNHILRNQLRLIRSSYHKLFPTSEFFGGLDEEHHLSLEDEKSNN